ncbi:pyridoxal-phosphate dependent [Proteus penneri]|nr:pyridoxal-phosphate dependent [Proteus penneri]
MKIIVEPTGCLSLAAARQFGDKLKGKKIGIIISGGNVDIAQYGRFLAQ